MTSLCDTCHRPIDSVALVGNTWQLAHMGMNNSVQVIGPVTRLKQRERERDKEGISKWYNNYLHYQVERVSLDRGQLSCASAPLLAAISRVVCVCGKKRCSPQFERCSFRIRTTDKKHRQRTLSTSTDTFRQRCTVIARSPSVFCADTINTIRQSLLRWLGCYSQLVSQSERECRIVWESER